MAQESSEEESDMESEREVAAKKDAQVTVEEKLEKIDLGTDPPKPRPISIKFKVVKERKGKIDLAVERVQRCLCLGL